MSQRLHKSQFYYSSRPPLLSVVLSPLPLPPPLAGLRRSGRRSQSAGRTCLGFPLPSPAHSTPGTAPWREACRRNCSWDARPDDLRVGSLELGRSGAEDAQLVVVQEGRREERRGAPSAARVGDGAERGAAQGRLRGPDPRRGAARGVDGAPRPEEDREVLLPHAVLRPRQQGARLLQEAAQGQHGMCCIVHLFGGICVPLLLLQNLDAVLVTSVVRLALMFRISDWRGSLFGRAFVNPYFCKLGLSRFLNFEEEGLTRLRCMEPGLDSGPVGIIVFGCRNHSSLPIVNCEVEGPIDVGTRNCWPFRYLDAFF